MKHIKAFALALMFCLIPCISFAAGSYYCDTCGKEVNYTWTVYVPKNETVHSIAYSCPDCESILNVTDQEEIHYWSSGSDYEQYNNQQHYIIESCEYCGMERKVPEEHDWNYGDTVPYNNTHHYRVQTCYYCGATRKVLEKHDPYSWDVIRYATPVTPGIETAECLDCDAKITRSIPWRLGDADSVDYSLDHSMIYRNSKSVRVYLNHALKGAVVKVKIGKKTYKKTVKSNSTKSVKIKIKKPKKAGKKVKVTMTYKGKLIGVDDCAYWDIVWYAKAVKIGMTKKQCRYTWGVPDRINKSSNGYEHWHWNNGDYLRFRRGRLDYWFTTG